MTTHHARFMPPSMFGHFVADLLLTGHAKEALEMQAELAQERAASAWDIECAPIPLLLVSVSLN